MIESIKISEAADNYACPGLVPDLTADEAAKAAIKFFAFKAGAAWMQEQDQWISFDTKKPGDGQKIMIWGPPFDDPEKRVWQSNWDKSDFSGYYWLPFPKPPKRAQQ